MYILFFIKQIYSKYFNFIIMRSLTVYFLPPAEKNRIRVGQLPKSVDILAVFHTKGIDQLSDFHKKATSE